ncbi:hypothetical protein VKS41_000258 [Umbelopsis sp. WA50703]
MSFLSKSVLPDSIDLYDLAVTSPSHNGFATNHSLPPIRSPKLLGNLALSSCPGKKVRLSGPVGGRAAINRDLDLDFARISRQFNITTIVCCLNDAELSFLGAPWPRYYEAATKHNIEIIRLPMLEGSCPHSIEEVDAVVDLVVKKMTRGENVLTHCRGGVGRAGLFACCWLLKNRFCLTAERAIRYVRLRRSPKSIETMRQAEFIIHYARYLKKLSDMQENGTLPDRDQNSIQQNHKILETGTQLSLPEPGLPHMFNNDIRLTIPNDIQIQHIEAQITLADSLDTNLMSFHTQPPIATPVIRSHTSPSILVQSQALNLYSFDNNEEAMRTTFM